MSAVLSADEARRLAVTAQALHRPGSESSRPQDVLGRLGCVQIDSMSAVRRSHELVMLARGVSMEAVSAVGTADQPGTSFEGWGHALSLIPMDLWPAFSFRRRHTAANGWRGPAVDAEAVQLAQQRLETEGRVRLSDFGKTTGTGWTRDSPFRWALEWLAATGRAVCAERERWQRVYALPSLVIPQEQLDVDMSDDQCVATLCHRALSTLGVATVADVADYFRLSRTQAGRGIAAAAAVKTDVEGWKAPAFTLDGADLTVDPAAVTALSPFDSVVWTRERQHRIFGKDYRLEAYKPAAARQFGYFAMPVLWGDRICGRLALRRHERHLVVENQEWDDDVPKSVAHTAIDQMATWTNSLPAHSEERSHASTC
jgi:uncharacterized protein YcaQ